MCHCHDFRQGLAALGTKPSLKRNVRGLPFSIVTYDAHLRPWVCNHFSILQAFAQTSHTHTLNDSSIFPGCFVTEFWLHFKSGNNCEVTNGRTKTACDTASAKHNFRCCGNCLDVWKTTEVFVCRLYKMDYTCVAGRERNTRSGCNCTR